MGQPVHLQLFAANESHGYEAAAAAQAELRRIEGHLSLFEDASDLSELNRCAGRRAVRVGADLAGVLSAALRFERRTRGAFNPAVEPLMRAWGFRTPRSAEPTSSELAAAKAAVEAAKLSIEGDRAALPSVVCALDLGGIGVGYGLDRAMHVLRREGIHRAFLDISGDCFALGAPPDDERGWRVEIAAPEKDGPTIAATYLRDAALATSSNQMSVIRYGRAVRGHVMDPETGWPAGRLTQISVVARTGIEADALSTAMLVSGTPARGVVRYYEA
jgi:thiamine biosynthesis lipoprotein